MSYVENNLMSDEKIIYKANIHWFIFLPGIILIILGILIIAGNQRGIGAVLTFIGILHLLKAFIWKTSTELAITSKRVIAKFGLFRRKTVELNHSKVESFNVDQSLLGRMFDYGTIVINGTGRGRTPIRSIDSPLDFRRNAMEAIDQSQQA